MRNLFCSLGILVLVLCQLSSAQNPLSFRSIALGGVIDDDLDLVFDPVELSFVKGVHVFTNLSNLTSSDEQILNNLSDKEFLVGISAKNPFIKSLWTSALVRFSNGQNSNPIRIDSDLDGWMDSNGEGTLENSFVSFIDNNYDGDYDIKKTIYQKKSDIAQFKTNSFILNNAIDLGGMILGLKFVYGSEYQKNITAELPLGSGTSMLTPVDVGDAEFSRRVTNHLLVEDYDDVIWSENGAFNSDLNSTYFIFHFSGLLKKVRDYELRADLKYHHSSNKDQTNDKYNGAYEYFDPNIGNYQNDYNESQAYRRNNEISGGGVYLGASLRRTFDQREQRKNDGYWRLGAGFFYGSYDYTEDMFSSFVSERNMVSGDPISDYSKTINSEFSSIDKGDQSSQTYLLNFKINYPFDENVYLGLGGNLLYSSVNRETDFSELTNDVTNYVRIDNASTYSDYTKTITSSIKADRNYEMISFVFNAPVGIEYKFTENKKWALRFGSVFNYYKRSKVDKKKILEAEPYTVKTKRGDGSSSTSISDNAYNSTKEETKTAYTETIFSYGLGYNATKNLQIDLLGFFGRTDNSLLDSSFYRALRLSFTLIF